MRKFVVVDANIALKWVIDEEDSHIAIALLSKWSRERIVMLAPALLAYEVANILYQSVRKGNITLTRAKAALTKVLNIGLKLDFSQDPALSIRAIELAEQYNIPATYDTHYLALAQHNKCELWTADTRMWRIVKDKLNWVRCIDDYHPASDGEEG